MKTICRMCHHPVTDDNRREVERRVERRAGVSGRCKGYAVLHEIEHKDCSKTPEALKERYETAKWALEKAGVTGARAEEALKSLR
jgi:hypothetical protein